MTEPETAPAWLIAAYRTVWQSTRPLTLLRTGTSSVWTDGKHVAKVMPIGATAHASFAQQRAREARRHVRCAKPQGVTSHGPYTLSWWGDVHVDSPSTSGQAGSWLRRLHDQATVPAGNYPDTPLTPIDVVNRELWDALAPMRQAYPDDWTPLARMPRVFLHGDPNPTNIVNDHDGVTIGLDFDGRPTGPRVLDLAVVTQVAAEQGEPPESALAAYGEHRDVTDAALARAMRVIAIERAHACTRIEQWEAEGWARLDAWRQGQTYRYPRGDGPK